MASWEILHKLFKSSNYCRWTFQPQAPHHWPKCTGMITKSCSTHTATSMFQQVLKGPAGWNAVIWGPQGRRTRGTAWTWTAAWAASFLKKADPNVKSPDMDGYGACEASNEAKLSCFVRDEVPHFPWSRFFQETVGISIFRIKFMYGTRYNLACSRASSLLTSQSKNLSWTAACLARTGTPSLRDAMALGHTPGLFTSK